MGFLKRKKPDPTGPRANGIPDGLWVKCASCQQTVYKSEVEGNLNVCPECGYHHRVSAHRRIEITVDPGSFTETHNNLQTMDPLHFTAAGESYGERISRAKEQSGLMEALVTGMASIHGVRTAIGVMDSSFIMASMGSVVGERFCRMAEDAVRERAPVVVFAASGGARMHEGILALMQMAKTADAVRQIKEARLPYISVLTDPTSGGVLASFASLGDVVIAEPNAYIGFAGTRLIQGALRIKLPEGFQRAEFQFENGFIDQIVKREDLRDFLGRLLQMLKPEAALQAG